MAREIIKMPKWYVITLATICIGVFIGSIIHVNYRARDYVAADIATEIEPVVINGDEGWRGDLRGAVFYKENRLVSIAILIAADCDESVLEKLYIKKRTLESIDHTPRFYLSRLRYPYQLSKKGGTDTIVIKKDDCELKFLMLKDEER